MPSYQSNELSQDSSKQTFLYWFVGNGFQYKWTNAPKTIVVPTVNIPPDGLLGDDIEFTKIRGGIAHREFLSSPDAGRTGLEIAVSHLNPLALRHRISPPPGETQVWVYRQNEIDGETRLRWSGILVEVLFDDPISVLRCQTEAEQILGSEGLTETFAPLCPYTTYHFPCPALKSNHRTDVVVTNIDLENFELTVTGITQIDGNFNVGIAQAINDDKRLILLHVGGVLTILQNFPSTSLRVGDTLTLFDGDDLTYTTCRDKFLETQNGDAFGGDNLQSPKNPHEMGKIQ